MHDCGFCWGLLERLSLCFGVACLRCYWLMPLTGSVQFGIETLMLYLGFEKQMEHHTDLFQPFCFANVLLELPLLLSYSAMEQLQRDVQARIPCKSG